MTAQQKTMMIPCPAIDGGRAWRDPVRMARSQGKLALDKAEDALPKHNPRLTEAINLQNVGAVRFGIANKINYNRPYYPTLDEVTAVVTDFDTFPYPRYFRGNYMDSEPRVFEREAGFRTRQDNCYRQFCPVEYTRPQFCYQNSCSTVLPCRPKEQAEYASKLEYDLIMKRGCIPTYR